VLFHQVGHFLLGRGDQFVQVAVVGRDLFQIGLGQGALQLGGFLHVLGAQQGLGAVDGRVEEVTGSSQIQLGDFFHAVEGGVHQGHHHFSVGFLGGGKLFDIRVGHWEILRLALRYKGIILLVEYRPGIVVSTALGRIPLPRQRRRMKPV